MAKRSGRKTGRVKGFYEGALEGAEAADFAAARQVEGIDDEIALLRVRIKEAWKSEGQDFELMLRSIRVLSQLVGARCRRARWRSWRRQCGRE